MSSIVFVTDKQGRRYAYRSFSYWDKEKKAPRSRKEYLGRVDEQGNIIPKKVAPESKTEEVLQTPAIPDSLSVNESVELLKRIEARLERIEAAISAFSDAWKTTDRGNK